MNNVEIGKIFLETADMLQIKGEDEFFVNKYREAADRILGHKGELSEMFEGASGNACKISGISDDVQGKIEEVVSTGSLKYKELLKQDFSPGFIELLYEGGIKAGELRKLSCTLGVQDLCQLERHCHRGDVALIEGFGERRQADLLKAIERIFPQQKRWALRVADIYADEIISYLSGSPSIQNVSKTGKLRRAHEKLERIELLASADDVCEALDFFSRFPEVKKVAQRKDAECVIELEEGPSVRLQVVGEDIFGSELLFATGSGKYNKKMRRTAAIKGYSLSESGLFAFDEPGRKVAGRTEKGIFENLGMQFIIPEMREDLGEIELALENRLAEDIIKISDVKGDLHVHTNVTDGADDVTEVIKAAKEKGYEYVAITDHTKKVQVVGGLNEEQMLRHLKCIRETAGKFEGIKVLAGAEVDILASGEMDMPTEVLKEMDIVIAAVHSDFTLPRDVQTERILKALSCPFVHVLAHPASRGIVSNSGIKVDMEKIFAKCAAKHIALELNTHNDRMDLSDHDLRAAVKFGNVFAINTDAHSREDLGQMRYGVKIAKRAGLRREAVINSMTYGELILWLDRT